MHAAPPNPAPSRPPSASTHTAPHTRPRRTTPRAIARTLLLASLPVSAFLAAATFLPWLFATDTLPPVALKLRNPEVATAIAHTLARYAQSDPALFPQRLDYAWLPESLNVIRHGTAEITPRGARVALGGGLHHFGYELTLDDAGSSPTTNAWRLSLYRKDHPPDPLLTVHLPRSERIEAPTLLTNLSRAYARQLAVFPADENAHRGRIRTLLRFGQPARARQAVRDMRTNLPENGWATVLNALIDAEERGLPAGDAAMEDYVRRHPDFFRLLDLAYFHQLTDRPGRAAEAVRRSLAHDVNITGGDAGDSEFRGFSAAMYLHRSGQHETAIALCQRLESAWINGDYAKPGLRALRAAAEQSLQGRLHPADWPAGMPPFQPFADLDVPRLLGREFTSHRSARRTATR
jgi:hypothetical protein